MKVFKEFQEFAMRGSVMDLAVGVIIGGAFGKIVSSLVNDIILPPIAIVLSGIDFKNLKLQLGSGIAFNYGAFIQNLIEFVIIAWAVFLMVKGINALKRRKAQQITPPPQMPPKEEQLLTEIRDLLRQK